MIESARKEQLPINISEVTIVYRNGRDTESRRVEDFAQGAAAYGRAGAPGLDGLEQHRQVPGAGPVHQPAVVRLLSAHVAKR